jgi:hypothetical protein
VARLAEKEEPETEEFDELEGVEETEVVSSDDEGTEE